MKEKIFILRVKLRHSVPPADLRQLIEEAVELWGRSLHPDDPLFSAIESAEAKPIHWHK